VDTPDRSHPTPQPAPTATERSNATTAPAASPAIPTTNDTARTRTPTASRSSPAERTRITGPPGTRRPLHRTAPDDNTIDRAARALHHEHTILLANPHATATSQTHARLEKLAHAA
jgi:hypothetical protein